MNEVASYLPKIWFAKKVFVLILENQRQTGKTMHLWLPKPMIGLVQCLVRVKKFVRECNLILN